MEFFADALSYVLPFLAVLTALAFGNGVANVSLTTLVSKHASEDAQGGAFGLTQSAGSLARIFGPVLAGFLYAFADYWAPFVLGGLLMVPILAILSSRAFSSTAPTPS